MSQARTATLWERFHGELLGFVRSRVASEDAAQDLLQSAYLRAHKHIVSGELPENPRAWLYQILRNLIVDAHRASARRGALADALAAEPTAVAEPAAPHETAGAEDDAFALVARALPMFIEQLDEPYRSALQMTEIEGFTQAEAARRAGISVSGMKSRVQRGRRLLRDALQRCCEFELDARGRMIACTPRACC